jgi:hypothetical protein
VREMGEEIKKKEIILIFISYRLYHCGMISNDDFADVIFWTLPIVSISK